MVVFWTALAVGVVFWIIGNAMDNKADDWRREGRSGDLDVIGKQRREAGVYSFTRINCVRGILIADGVIYHTFNNGTLTYDDCVDIRILSTTEFTVVEDISLHGNSLAQYVPRGLPNEQTAEYMLNLLKEASDNGHVSEDVVREVVETVEAVYFFDELRQRGWIKAPAWEADYVWTKDM